MKGRKYRKGPPIESLDEVMKQEFIYYRDKIMHHGFFASLQYRTVKEALDRRWLFYAIKRKENEQDETPI